MAEQLGRFYERIRAYADTDEKIGHIVNEKEADGYQGSCRASRDDQTAERPATPEGHRSYEVAGRTRAPHGQSERADGAWETTRG